MKAINSNFYYLYDGLYRSSMVDYTRQAYKVHFYAYVYGSHSSKAVVLDCLAMLLTGGEL